MYIVLYGNPDHASLRLPMIELFELGGLRGKRYSLFSWRSRMALAHKGLSFEPRPVKISDKAAIAFSGQQRVPILRSGEIVISGSWQIAEHLERTHRDAPSLFGGESGRALARFVNNWVDRSMIRVLAPNVALHVLACVEADDGAHIRTGFEKGFGKTLEEMHAARDAGLARFRQVMEPLRATVKTQRFLGGDRPAYADYIAFSPLQWARIVSSEPVLATDDPICAWFERLLDLHGELARREPAGAQTP